MNANFAQMMDFPMGFMGLDPAGDDGKKYGAWPWQIDGWPYRDSFEEAAPKTAKTGTN